MYLNFIYAISSADTLLITFYVSWKYSSILVSFDSQSVYLVLCNGTINMGWASEVVVLVTWWLNEEPLSVACLCLEILRSMSEAGCRHGIHMLTERGLCYYERDSHSVSTLSISQVHTAWNVQTGYDATSLSVVCCHQQFSGMFSHTLSRIHLAPSEVKTFSCMTAAYSVTARLLQLEFVSVLFLWLQCRFNIIQVYISLGWNFTFFVYNSAECIKNLKSESFANETYFVKVLESVL